MLKTLSGFHVYSGGHVANILVLIFGRKHLFSGNFCKFYIQKYQPNIK